MRGKCALSQSALVVILTPNGVERPKVFPPNPLILALSLTLNPDPLADPSAWRESSTCGKTEYPDLVNPAKPSEGAPCY